MGKIKCLYIFSFLILAACSSSSIKSDDHSAKAVATAKPIDAASVKEVSKNEFKQQEAAAVKAMTAPLPQDINAQLSLAIKAQNDEQIFKLASQMLFQNANDVRALNAIGLYNYKKGRFDVAEYLFRRALKEQPKSAELYTNLGLVAHARGEKSEAVKMYHKALEINPNDPLASANAGTIYVQEMDYVKANIVLETAYRKGLKDYRILNNYGISLAATGHSAKAKDMYQMALKEQQGNKEIMLNYAILLIDHLGEYKEGMDVINRLKFSGPLSESRNRINSLENKAKAGLK